MSVRVTLPDGQTVTLEGDLRFVASDPTPEPPDPTPEPPTPEPPPPAPEPPVPEPPVPGASVLCPDARGVNARFAQPYLPGVAVFADRLRLYRTVGTGVTAGFGGATRLVLTGPEAGSASAWSLGERGTGPVQIVEQSAGRAVIEGDPMGEAVIEGIDPLTHRCVPEDLEGLGADYDPRFLDFHARADSFRPLQVRGANAIVKGPDGVIYDDDRVPLPDGWWEGDFARGGSEIEWSERIQPGFPAKGGGFLSWEETFDIFSATCARPGARTTAIHLNPPHQCSIDYVRRLGMLARDRLPEGTEVLLAHGNEIWNSAPPYSLGLQWCGAQGLALGLQSGELGGDEYSAALLFHAIRTAQYKAAFVEGYGDHGPVVSLFEWFGANPWGMSEAIRFARQYGDIDAMAIAPYFGHGLDLASFSSPNEAIAAFSASLDQVIEEQHQRCIDIASDAGIPCMWYEGGQHATNASGWPGDRTAWGNMADRVVWSEGMAALYRRQIDDWTARGGVCPTHYADAAYPNDSETFGLKRHFYEPETPTEREFFRR